LLPTDCGLQIREDLLWVNDVRKIHTNDARHISPQHAGHFKSEFRSHNARPVPGTSNPESNLPKYISGFDPAQAECRENAYVSSQERDGNEQDDRVPEPYQNG
jgi:hypothetical protein